MKLTEAEALDEIESLIEQYRYARARPSYKQHRTYLALRAAADDLRGRDPAKLSETEKELAAALDAVERSKTALGFREECLRDLALKVRAYWPSIRVALQRMNQ